MKRGIVLINLGSPDSTSVGDVRKYLNEFLMDKRVIDIPYLGRLMLVRGMIVPFRAPKSAHAYQSIWTDKGSPLIVLTQELEAALQAETEYPVTIAMRYGRFPPREAFDELLRREPGLEEVLLVPLYPHFAMSSYETAVQYAREQYAQGGYKFRLTVVPPYYDEPNYLDALAGTIRPWLQEPFDHVLFSFHGVPERHIYKGDPTGQHCLRSPDCCSANSVAHRTCYPHHCLVTMKAVAARLGLGAGQFSFSFQSRLGREEWVKPYTAQRLADMPGEGIKKLLVVCPAFISDCLETLEEISVEGRDIFLGAGGESFHQIPCLNVDPAWVKVLKGYAEKAYAESEIPA
ncbi:ferrochelatase [Flavihumibacter petaseus]|uniref:Ferrochelatase n=1 Tax=Flavihumibacter petaseus NBRC 106054 TaxID=1220578 RepID=A0A0E9MW93_9BACT|nr:ferrochelatase [Flavihumibacter petaseus]GAO41783.1 ferrochelatase [Flavihumibacter petaseus NBRC 106054]